VKPKRLELTPKLLAHEPVKPLFGFAKVGDWSLAEAGAENKVAPQSAWQAF
jgi:hypothetical protein